MDLAKLRKNLRYLERIIEKQRDSRTINSLVEKDIVKRSPNPLEQFR